jgi:hypothetical protein
MNNRTRMPFGEILLSEAASSIVGELVRKTPPVISHAEWMRALSTVTDGRVSFEPTATNGEMKQAEDYFGFRLPEELRELWNRTRAITFDGTDLIFYSPEMMCSKHRELVEMNHFMPLDHLLFIGASGDGDEFAFGRRRNGEISPVIYRWSHDSDSRVACALGLYDYIHRHLAWRTTEMPRPA